MSVVQTRSGSRGLISWARVPYKAAVRWEYRDAADACAVDRGEGAFHPRVASQGQCLDEVGREGFGVGCSLVEDRDDPHRSIDAAGEEASGIRTPGEALSFRAKGQGADDLQR